jgi:hypothetical protein
MENESWFQDPATSLYPEQDDQAHTLSIYFFKLPSGYEIELHKRSFIICIPRQIY